MAYARCILAMLIALFAVPCIAAKSDEAIVGLKTEYQNDPLGIDVTKPRFSWQSNSRARGAGQSAYEIRVATDRDALRGARPLIWDSGKIDSRQSIFLSYGGPALQSRTRYFWQVRLWDERGSDLGWSRVANWEMTALARRVER
jgi:alpha-L-rhamnosidase